MSNVLFISDLHLGHENIMKFSSEHRAGSDITEHDAWIVERWNSVVRPKDVVYLLGDVAFTPTGLTSIARLNGRIKLLRGNHDEFSTAIYSELFDDLLPGLFKYKEFWLSHCPIHPAELRGRRNIHGHVHHKSIPDDRYINVCVEPLRGAPISLDQIRSAVEAP